VYCEHFLWNFLTVKQGCSTNAPREKPSNINALRRTVEQFRVWNKKTLPIYECVCVSIYLVNRNTHSEKPLIEKLLKCSNVPHP
jgi:hypothetical protein